MDKVLVRVQPQFTSEELDIIRRTVASKTTNDQFKLFIQVCKYSGLNPFARQIYAVVRGTDMTIQTGIDGYRILAERSGKYAGQIGPEWCDESGEWKDVWLSSKSPVASRIGVLRRDFEKPIWGVARFASYEQSSSPLWRKMPEVMLAKCAESLALRKAFPAEMAGIYTEEEMSQADRPMPAPPPVPIEGEVVDVSETHQDAQQTPVAANAPTMRALYQKGKDKGLWANTSGFCAFASAELGVTVGTDTQLSAEDRVRLDTAIDEEKPIAQAS